LPTLRTGGEVGMKERVPHMCITCKHYEPYHCTLNDGYIGYLYCQEPTKCKAWHLHKNYKRGGKWYDDRPEKQEGR
jgi:hypothetical protein